MKFLKKILILMSFILVFFTFSSATNVQAASISKTKVTLLNGQSVSLKVKGKSGKIKWSSSKKSVATVNSKWIVKAKKKGTAKITAKIGKKKYTCKVTVQSPKLSKTKLSLKYGKSYKLKLSGTNQKVKWSSSDANVATVSSKGKITAKGNGTSIITAIVLGKRFNCKVTVSGSPNKVAEFSETEARKNISVTTQVIGGDIVVFFDSHYEWNTGINCSCYYYDQNKKPIYVSGSDTVCVESGRRSAIIFESSGIDYDTFEIRYNNFYRESLYPNEVSLANYIHVSTNRTEDRLLLTFNSSYTKYVDGARVIVKYYDIANNLVAIDDCWCDKIPPNGYAINDLELPRIWDKETDTYSDVNFSRCEIYVSHVYVD